MHIYDVEHSDKKRNTKIYYLNDYSSERFFYQDIPVYKLTRKIDKLKVVGYIDTTSRIADSYYEKRKDTKPYDYLYFDLRADEVEQSIVDEVGKNKIKCYLPVYKTLRGRPEAFIKISEEECLGIGKEKELPLPIILPIIVLAFLIVTIMVRPITTKDAPQSDPGSEPDDTLMIGDYGDIGEYTPTEENIVTNTDMAYISGSSTAKVSKRNPYVELKNLGQNTNYLFEYYVYKDDIEIFHTEGLIPANKEALWDAYNCKDIVDGENEVKYTVNVYDYDGNKVTGADINGITIIKR